LAASSLTILRITNGRIYDPINDIDGEVRDICVKDGKIVADVDLPPEAKRIDAQDMVVMPGGVDMHAHIAGPKVNLARKLMPEDHRRDPHPRARIPGQGFTRSGSGGSVPSTFATGYRYAMLGYTTVMEAAVPPLGARHALEELHDTPIIDKGFYTLMGNNVLLFKLIQEGRRDDLRNAVAWWLNAARAYTTKLVNPGGVEMWKRGNRNVTNQDDPIEGYDITPRQVIEAIATAVDELGLPHPIHLHCNNLGHSGNYQTTLDTMQALQGRRAHITHIQFHCYGGKVGGKPTSKASEIIAYLNDHPETTADVGQVMFGQAATMTADAPLSYMLYQVTGSKWINADVEHESGCGIVPFVYQDHNYVHALQWGIGLELFLLNDDPWRMVLSTDHPNGGSFLSYPRLIRLLMDRQFRNEQIRSVNQAAMKKTVLLDDLAREYTLQEIAIVTRAGPARLLGLKNKGHLGVGADADITIYEDKADKEEMFSTPRYVIKSGEIIIEDGEFRADHEGKVLHVAPAYDPQIVQVIKPFFDDYYSIQFENYPVSDHYLHDHEVIPMRTTDDRRRTTDDR
jgi:formylmethanofuran dehydrogenase subunit A